jgi:hypothetical protein
MHHPLTSHQYIFLLLSPRISGLDSVLLINNKQVLDMCVNIHSLQLHCLHSLSTACDAFIGTFPT